MESFAHRKKNPCLLFEFYFVQAKKRILSGAGNYKFIALKKRLQIIFFQRIVCERSSIIEMHMQLGLHRSYFSN